MITHGGVYGTETRRRKQGKASKQTNWDPDQPGSPDPLLVGLAGGILIIIGGEQLLSIHTPVLRAPGAIANTYYRGLWLAIVGFGAIVAVRSLWACFRSLEGRWNSR